jgi:hypothetical protein
MTQRDNRNGRRGILVVVALIAGLSVAPGAALAQHDQGAATGSPRLADGRPVPSRPVMPRPPFPHPPHHHFVSVWSPVVVYVPPPVAYEPATYYAPPAIYDPAELYPATVSTAPPESTAGTIEYPTGRYELRGDGVTVPYTWVWIPNPPPLPPAAVPEVGPPPPSATPAAPDPSPALHTRLYHWTDEQGVVHVTDIWDAVPSRYQAQAKQVLPF